MRRRTHAKTLSASGWPMLGAIVSRSQYAVGHGGFHAGKIKIVHDANGLGTGTTFLEDGTDGTICLDQAYVYDCGSEHGEAFSRAMQAYLQDYADNVDILFVSHLHADHINGLDALVSYKAPRVVVLPYLDLEDLAATALRDFAEGHFSGTYRDYLRDPVGWWHNRGVPTVVFIEPGGDDGAAPAAPAPDEPGGGGAGAWDVLQPAGRLAAYLQKPNGDIPKGLEPAKPDETTLEASGGILAGPGSLFRVDWRFAPGDAWRSADWVLVPYVHPVGDPQRAAFRNTVLQHMSLNNPSPQTFRDAILERLKEKTQAKRLVRIYDDHFGANHNAVSLSLYSGPASLRRRPYDRSWRLRDASPSDRFPDIAGDLQAPCGWLGTGDSMLRQDKRRHPWRNFYTTYRGNIGILTLPHHGSFHNFHDEILDWSGLWLALATTVPSQGRIAGLNDTLDCVMGKRKHALVVDDQASHTFSVEARRLMAP